MKSLATSIRPFIGAKDYELSRSFYRYLGFEETILLPDMCLFKTGLIAFYLQNAYVKDWIENTMIFAEVENVDTCRQELLDLDLAGKFKGVKLSPVHINDWGRECFLHDPSGILWHFGQFNSR